MSSKAAKSKSTARPLSFDGNVMEGNAIRFVGEMQRAMRLIAKLAVDPALKAAFRREMGLDDGSADPPVQH
jgi:hypothetical protein